MSVGLALLAGHMLADFPFQSDEVASNKLDNWPTRAYHSYMHGLLSYVIAGLYLGGGVAPIATGLTVFVCHFVIDSRRWAEPKESFEEYPIWVDQSLHVTSLVIALEVGRVFL